MRLSEYFNEYIFAPLGIEDIGFKPSAEQRSRISAMYNFNKGLGTSTEIPSVSLFDQLPNFESGGGGLFSSVRDYVKVLSAIASNGETPDGYRILKPETVEMMKVNYLNDETVKGFVKDHGYRYGYGWGLCGRVHVDPVLSLSPSPVGEFGWSGAANAYALMDTDNRLAIFYATHVMGASYGYDMVHTKLRDLVYDAISK